MTMGKIEKGTMNVYADLGVADAEEMLVKAQLAAKIAEIIKLRKLTQTQAASLLGMTQPKLSNMLRGRFRGISEAKMLECMTLLGRDVQIVVKPASRSRKTGHVSVLFA
jgi:predicted XRE-type DNA-binding protein